MTGIKKVALDQESDHKKSPLDNIKIYKNSHANINYQGRYNRTCSGAELVEYYMTSARFFKAREKYHNDASLWYYKESLVMLEKSKQEDKKTEICGDSYRQYLNLAGIATLKSMGVGVNE